MRMTIPNKLDPEPVLKIHLQLLSCNLQLRFLGVPIHRTHPGKRNTRNNAVWYGIY